MLISRSTLLHLRFPFSFFLMPIFCFAVAVSHPSDYWLVLWVFLILHVLVYPASNGFNSFYDKDEESIGGLEKPPPVSTELLYVSLLLDLLATLCGFLINFWFGLGIIMYGLASKAYSYEGTRLKKYPIAGWLVVVFFQGAFTVWLTYQGIMNDVNGWLSFSNPKISYAGLLSTWMLLGSYPMTQVYQHAEDSKRGDRTLSIMLGIRGTFLFTLSVFGLAGIGYFLFFWHYYHLYWAMGFLGALFPVVIYFMLWFLRVLKDERNADFRSTMRLNLISALCLNIFFCLLAWWQ
jgi:UbiA prenyltransferase family